MKVNSQGRDILFEGALDSFRAVGNALRDAEESIRVVYSILRHEEHASAEAAVEELMELRRQLEETREQCAHVANAGAFYAEVHNRAK